MTSSKTISRLRTQILAAALGAMALVGTAAESALAQKRVLVYTRNYTPDGKGYVHESIAASVAAIQRMGVLNGFAVDVTADAAVFTDANLKQYSALVFSNSNNEAFSAEAQREAFKRYIQGGGGFVGIHSASGSQRDWPYFWSVLGGKFVEHPKMQTFTLRVVDTAKTIVRDGPMEFQWTDEVYFTDHQNPGLHPVLVVDRKKLQFLDAMKNKTDSFPDPLPLAWWQKFDGGREYYVALGHNKEDYENPILYNLIQNGIIWAMTP